MSGKDFTQAEIDQLYLGSMRDDRSLIRSDWQRVIDDHAGKTRLGKSLCVCPVLPVVYGHQHSGQPTAVAGQACRYAAECRNRLGVRLRHTSKILRWLYQAASRFGSPGRTLHRRMSSRCSARIYFTAGLNCWEAVARLRCRISIWLAFEYHFTVKVGDCAMCLRPIRPRSKQAYAGRSLATRRQGSRRCRCKQQARRSGTTKRSVQSRLSR